jgi:hypothetical protein
MNEFAALLYDKVNNLEQEGLKYVYLMQQKYKPFFRMEIMEKSDLEVELIMSSLYFFYADRVFKGLDTKKTAELGWYLPKKNNLMSTDYSLLQDPNLINKQLEDLPGQYYLLKEYFRVIIILQKRAAGIQLSFQKNQITTTRDTSDVILQIRKRLFITGDLIIDSRQKHLIMSCWKVC